jgi:amino acid transporter
MAIIMGLAAYWIAVGNKIATPMHHWQFWVPNWRDIGNIGFFSNILFSLLGIEVIAVYAGSVLQPKKTYPQAVAIAAWIILMTLILSSLALCVIVPAEKIGLLTGLVDVIQVFFAACHLEKMTLIIGCCIIIGGLGIASSWMLGLAKSLHISLTSMPMIPDWLKQLNHHQVPTRILGLQGLIYSLLLTAFLFMPSLNRSYWMLSAATAQFALVYYMILFSAAVKLLNLQTKRVFNLLFPLMGLIICGIGLFAGFIPPVDLVGLSS